EFDMQIKKLSAIAEENVLRAETIQKNARERAESSADSIIFVIRISGAVFIASCALFLGYADKFIIPSLPKGMQPNGNWIIILLQFLLFFMSAGAFVEKPTAWLFTRLRKRVLRSRLVD